MNICDIFSFWRMLHEKGAQALISHSNVRFISVYEKGCVTWLNLNMWVSLFKISYSIVYHFPFYVLSSFALTSEMWFTWNYVQSFLVEHNNHDVKLFKFYEFYRVTSGQYMNNSNACTFGWVCLRILNDIFSAKNCINYSSASQIDWNILYDAEILRKKRIING